MHGAQGLGMQGATHGPTNAHTAPGALTLSPTLHLARMLHHSTQCDPWAIWSMLKLGLGGFQGFPGIPSQHEFCFVHGSELGTWCIQGGRGGNVWEGVVVAPRPAVLFMPKVRQGPRMHAPTNARGGCWVAQTVGTLWHTPLWGVGCKALAGCVGRGGVIRLCLF